VNQPPVKSLEGLWRLASGRAWDADGHELPPPYGELPFGEILFRGGRMLAALCNGDAEMTTGSGRGFSSYGGFYTVDGDTLITRVDVASDPQRIGGEQRREVVWIDEDTLMLRPPSRAYEGRGVERRELVWQRVWQPDGATADRGPIVIERQGSFFVGGRMVTASGTYDGTVSVFPPNTGQTFWVDHMYVQFQVPPRARRLPIVLVHGGGGTGRVWESTPDGREGYQTLFLRRGFGVYIVDAPRGGRSGFPSFNGDFGRLDDSQQLVPARTSRPGREHGWSRWRLGPAYPEVYETQAFPMQAVDAFYQHLRPLVSDDPALIAASIEALLEQIGPAILVTHSNSGLWGWLAGARSDKVRAIVSYEPGVVFPMDAMPAQIPLFSGVEDAGAPVSEAEFQRLSRIPIQVVFGDNIPTEPVPDLPADKRRAQVLAAHQFAAALNARGGEASVQMLPEAGLRGNSHFMFSDLNNVQVADQLSTFLARHGLDAR